MVVIAWFELGAFVFLVAATAVGATEAIRKAPLIRGWNEQGIKPWACDLCMSFWLTLIVVLLAVVVPSEPQLYWIGAWMPAFALAYSWLTRVTPVPVDVHPGLPELVPGKRGPAVPWDWDDEATPVVGDESE